MGGDWDRRGQGMGLGPMETWVGAWDQWGRGLG
jgi:hypothetical protein